MAVVLPVKGSLNWDVSLNAALTYLDNNNTTTVTNALQRVNNLSDLTNVPAARSNLGLSAGTAAGVNNYNVKDYGALGNGVADDTAAIQAAINAATNGGTVYFPTGNYIVNGVQITIPNVGTVLRGAGAENTKITMNSSFTGASIFNITANTCEITDMTIQGANSTTTSNPVADAIQVNAVRRAKVSRCVFWFINGIAINIIGGTGSSNNPDGTMIVDNIIRSSAGGIKFLGFTGSGFAVNSFILNNQIISGGTSTGGSANLDGVHIEDSWDILMDNNLVWQTVGSGASLHIKGSCAASFIKNFDGLGPVTGNCILIEDGPNGSPQNTQINGGVIQQGLIGLNVTGGATQQHYTSLRFINNQTHGAAIAGTGVGIHMSDLFFSTSGQGATGTNYDINWSGTATGYITGCSFSSPIVATLTAGVQQTLNFPASAPVRVMNCAFIGTSASSANWYTNQPLGFMEASGGQYDFASTVKFTNTTTSLTAMANLATQPSAFGNTVISSNLAGTATFDTFRLTGDGQMAIGPGGATGTRDVFYGRTSANTLGLTTTDLAIVTAGRGVKVAEGTNAKMGTATLNGTTNVTVSTTAVNANSRVYLTTQAASATYGAPVVVSITAGTSFTIKSTVAGDTSTVAWLIVDHT